MEKLTVKSKMMHSRKLVERWDEIRWGRWKAAGIRHFSSCFSSFM